MVLTLLIGGAAAVWPAAALAGGNAGDVWVDNVGQPPGPGHEQDPHLGCSNINLWGNGLADPSGNYTVDGWAPSGSMKEAWASTWHYNQSQGGSQVLDTNTSDGASIPVLTLIAKAKANGDKPVNGQGFHFKLQFAQNPQKHKTFWVPDCPSPSSPPPGTPPPTTTTTSTTPPTTTTTTSPTSGVKGVTKQKKHKKHKKHKRVKAKTISRPPKVSSGFTG